LHHSDEHDSENETKRDRENAPAHVFSFAMKLRMEFSMTLQVILCVEDLSIISG